ncbi:hypothetical protein NUACC21_78940 [Scytonema sp. NUACC21]
MILLHIALQDGFLNDETIVHVNCEEVFHQSQVKTRFQIGLATSFETNVQKGLVNVKVTLPNRKLAQSTVLEISAPTYLGVSITADNKIVFHVSNQQFRYL